MENWVTFLIVNILLVIVLGVITNLITPSIKSAYEKSIFSSRQMRIQALIKEYRKIRNYRQDGILLIIIAIRNVAQSLIMFSLAFVSMYLTIISGFASPRFGESLVTTFAIYFSVMIVLSSFLLHVSTIAPINNTLRFISFKRKLREKIKKLGGNPEDLDKEETENQGG